MNNAERGVEVLEGAGYQAVTRGDDFIVVQDPVRVNGRIEYKEVVISVCKSLKLVWRFLESRS